MLLTLSIPTKTLKLLRNDISNQLSELFNLLFSLCVFPSILSLGHSHPTFEKVSKLKCSKDRPMSLLSSIDKIVERFKYNRLHEFLEFKNLIFDIQFDFRQKHSEAGVQWCS